jgi:hypothetical protein
MRKFIIGTNLLVSLFFLAFFTATYVAVDHMKGLGRAYVIQKTVEFTERHVDTFENVLDEAQTDETVTSDQANPIRQEIKRYRSDPEAYITGVVQGPRKTADNGTKNSFLAKITALADGMADEFKDDVRAYYDSTLAALITDLRIFAGSNFCAAALALLVALFAQNKRLIPLLWFSFLMLLALFYCTYIYVDDLTFFSIMMKSHMGWFYPILLGLVTLDMLRKYGRLGFFLREEVLDQEKEAA